MAETPDNAHQGHTPIADVVALTESQLPLGPLLRAAAEETPNRRHAAAFRSLADSIDAGRPWEAALADARLRLPGGVAALLAAGGEQAQVQEAVADLVEFDATSQELLRAVYSTIAYPLALLMFAYGCFVFVEFIVVGPMANLYQEMEIEMLPTTRILVRLHDFGWWLVLAPLIAAALAGLFLCCAGATRRDRVLATVPLFGPLLHFYGVAQGTRALAHLVERRQPLPEALRSAARALRDANIAEVWQRLAVQIEQGRAFSDALLATHRVPMSLTPLVRWGEATHGLAEALLLASDMFAGRVRLRAEMIRTVLPPVMFIIIGAGAFFVVVALVAPMLSLIMNLSGI